MYQKIARSPRPTTILRHSSKTTSLCVTTQNGVGACICNCGNYKIWPIYFDSFLPKSSTCKWTTSFTTHHKGRHSENLAT